MLSDELTFRVTFLKIGFDCKPVLREATQGNREVGA